MTQNKEYFILNSDERIPIIITQKSGIKNITMRPKTCPVRELHISIPRWTSAARAYKFIDEKRTWLNRAFAKQTEKIKLSPGDMITICGIMHEVHSCPLEGRGRTSASNSEPRSSWVGVKNNNSPTQELLDSRCSSSQLYPAPQGGRNAQAHLIISGSPEFFERRLKDKIKEMFLQKTKEIIATVPRELRPTKIMARDTTTRWGSCSSTGTISLSWRLAFAPMDVMRYVIMHEIAHRRHMNHSADFWALTGELYGPGYERAKTWLSKHGHELHRYF